MRREGGRGVFGARRPSGMDADGLPIVGSGIDLTKVRAAPRPGLGCWAGPVLSPLPSPLLPGPPLPRSAPGAVPSRPLRLRQGSGRNTAKPGVQGHGLRAEVGVTGGRPKKRSRPGGPALQPGRLPERDLGAAPCSAVVPLLCGCLTPASCSGLNTDASWPS